MSVPPPTQAPDPACAPSPLAELKRRNVELLLEDIRQGREVFRGLPDIVNFNSTSVCNLRCVQCFQAYAPGTKTLPPARVEHILDQLLPTARKLRLTTAGEPIGEGFEQILEIARRHECRLEIITNATKLTPERMAGMEDLLEHIAISIDSHVERTLDSIRGQGVHRRVTGNLRAVREYLSGRPRGFRTSLNLVLMTSNLPELAGFVRFASELGVDHVRVLRMSYMTTALRDTEDPFTCFERAEIERHVQAAQAEARALGQNLYLQEVGFDNVLPAPCPEPFPPAVETPYCEMMVREVYIQPDETLTPCCIPADLVMGSLQKSTFAEIWNNKRYQRLRAQMFSQRLSGPCAHCKHYTAKDDPASYDWLPGSQARHGFLSTAPLRRWIQGLRRPAGAGPPHGRNARERARSAAEARSGHVRPGE